MMSMASHVTHGVNSDALVDRLYILCLVLVIVSPEEIRESGFYLFFLRWFHGPFLPIGRKIFAFGTKRKAQFKDDGDSQHLK